MVERVIVLAQERTSQTEKNRRKQRGSGAHAFFRHLAEITEPFAKRSIREFPGNPTFRTVSLKPELC